MSRILITGATGFVGAETCRVLRAAGHSLSGTTRKADLPQAPGGVPLYRIGELGVATDWSRVVAGAEIVVHLAARAHVMGEGGADALAVYRATNRDGSRRLAEAAAAAGVRRFIFMSSVKAAGEETHGAPFRESDVPHPEDAYGVSKWEAEQDLAEVAARTGLELVVLRPPLVYGPEARGNLLTLLKACAGGWPLPFANLDNRRSLISRTNLASAVAACISNSSAAGRTFYVRDDEDLSTPDLIRRLAHAMGREARLFRVPNALLALGRRVPGIGDKLRRLTGSLQIDSRAICETLGWAPVQTTEQGLGETARWYLSARRGVD